MVDYKAPTFKEWLGQEEEEAGHRKEYIKIMETNIAMLQMIEDEAYDLWNRLSKMDKAVDYFASVDTERVRRMSEEAGQARRDYQVRLSSEVKAAA